MKDCTATRLMLSICVLIGVACAAEAGEFALIHKRVVDLSGSFGDRKVDGIRSLSVTCDGANVYIGGVSGKHTPSVGIIKVTGIGTDHPEITPLEATQFTPLQQPGLQYCGYNAIAFDREAGALLVAHDSGEPTTSFLRRLDPVDGSVVWNVSNFESERPAAMAIDPKGDAGRPAVAYLVEGAPRVRLLSITTGEPISMPEDSGDLQPGPNPFEMSWRALAFDPSGNVAVAAVPGCAYGTRAPSQEAGPRWQRVGGQDAGTSSVVTKRGAKLCMMGPSIAILNDVGGRDLIALSAQHKLVTHMISLNGEETDVADTKVYIRTTDGSADGVSTTELRGDEDGVGEAWTGNTKGLWFGELEPGGRALIVLDHREFRLDVYAVHSEAE